MKNRREMTGKIGSTAIRIASALLLAGLLAAIAESQSPTDTTANLPGEPAGSSPQRLAGTDRGAAAKLGVSSRPLEVADFPNVGASGDMIGFSHCDSGGTQTITLVHTRKSWIAVYHIDRSGKLRLVSSRPIDADFSLQLNATSPLPEEIRQFGGR